jgi:flavin-dependent dehydrogenase
MPASGSRRTVDVLILGAGPAGSGLAIALKRAGVADVLLIDRPARRPFRMGEAAAPGLGPLLRRLGLDDRLDSRGHRPCHGNLLVWGGPAPVAEDFMRRASGPGWHLDREAFDLWLKAEAAAAGAELLCPANLATIRRDRECWQAEIRAADIKTVVKARWIVDATGRPSAIARRLGARLNRLDRLISLAVLAAPAESSGFDGFSMVEGVEIGWWYASRLPGGEAVVALMTDADLAREADLRSLGAFRRAWAETSEIGRLVPMPDHLCRPVVFAAGTQFIDRAIAPGWLALGDALTALDPLSASGVTGALEDVVVVADTLVRLLDIPDRGEARDLRLSYAARANATLKRFLLERRAIYGAERRWSKSCFWQRRAVAMTP